jgi:hypothetical protein
LVAKSFFNDTFQLFRKFNNGTSQEIEINQKGIAWTSDVEQRFKNVQRGYYGTWRDVQWLDMENEHFIVWMRSAALSNFQKLWGKFP